MNQRIFMTRVNNILKDNAGMRRVSRRRSGPALDAGALARVPAGEYRVFEKFQKKQFHDYVVMMLIDSSGSMYNGPPEESSIGQATLTAHAISWALTACGASKVRVATFSDNVTEIPTATLYDLTKLREFAQEAGGGGTDEGGAVQWAVGQLMAESAPGKILYVFSDGCPNDSGHLQSSIAYGRKNGVTVLSLGIQSESTQMLYGARYSDYLRENSEMYGKTARMLDTHIKRG